MAEVLYVFAGVALGGSLVYCWQRGLLKSERFLREQLTQQYDGRLNELRITREQLDTTFQAAASHVLQGEARQYRETAEQDLRQVKTEATSEINQQRRAIETDVADLRKQLQDANAKIKDFETERSKQYQNIANQLSKLEQQEGNLLTETSRLKTVLTTSGAVRGRWGEIVLKNILIAADLTEGIDFVEQASTTGPHGDRLRPDLLVKLPNCGQALAIDSKAPLYDCYLRADAATTDEERRKLHQQFTRNLRNRVLELSSKGYEKYVSNAAPFIVMFLPSEAAFRAAFDSDPELFQWAKDRRVMIASPVTIVPLILLIAHAWQQFKVSTAAAEIHKVVEQLGTRLENFVERLSRVQKGLETASKAWNEAIEKSWFGQQSVVKSFEKVKELGGSIGKIPDLASVNAQLAFPPARDACVQGDLCDGHASGK